MDRAVVDLLACRAALVDLVWQHKQAAGLAQHDPAREAAIYADLLARAQASGLDRDRVRAVLGRIVGIDLIARTGDALSAEAEAKAPHRGC